MTDLSAYLIGLAIGLIIGGSVGLVIFAVVQAGRER